MSQFVHLFGFDSWSSKSRKQGVFALPQKSNADQSTGAFPNRRTDDDMLSAQFIFETSTLDEEFFTLDALIDDAARENEGFVGKDNWVTEDGSRRNSIYYWNDEQSLRAFAMHPKHLEAKRRYQDWYSGFHIVISEVKKSYGDSAFTHVTPNSRARK